MGRSQVTEIRAGNQFEICVRPWINPSDSPKERAAKQKLSTAARQKLNFRAMYVRLARLIAANFSFRDYWVTLTYMDEFLPPDAAAARKCLAKYIKRLRVQFGHRGLTLKYIYTTESVPDYPGAPGRIHHHIIISAIDPEIIKSLWGLGQVDVEPLLDGPNDSTEARARYMVKERDPDAEGRKPGKRGWTPSLNLEKPQVTTYLVPDYFTITPPPGAFILDKAELVNYFGAFQYLKCLLRKPPHNKAKRPPGKRPRRP